MTIQSDSDLDSIRNSCDVFMFWPANFDVIFHIKESQNHQLQIRWADDENNCQLSLSRLCNGEKSTPSKTGIKFKFFIVLTYMEMFCGTEEAERRTEVVKPL